jgi:hypothetical protein
MTELKPRPYRPSQESPTPELTRLKNAWLWASEDVHKAHNRGASPEQIRYAERKRDIAAKSWEAAGQAFKAEEDAAKVAGETQPYTPVQRPVGAQYSRPSEPIE